MGYSLEKGCLHLAQLRACGQGNTAAGDDIAPSVHSHRPTGVSLVGLRAQGQGRNQRFHRLGLGTMIWASSTLAATGVGVVCNCMPVCVLGPNGRSKSPG